MDSFNVIISPKALSQLNNYIDYLQHTLLNDQAAYSIWQDALETQKQLSKTAKSLKLCSHPQLKEKGYHIINFTQHRYLMLYRVEGATVYVDAIYHQLQDYENVFATELN
ncbi:MAG: type II toxin-antitoxin system RelE/ParE family toxin [Ruminococcus flavefaciens]|nr:type II toxin-antitoxin system RelE/ParE family toxin [Roseburia sp.]MCM1232578.1 type II toxin-antitoxin system RelE/ParE family toxin [Ruminococcus flavefaciens]